MRKLLFLMLFVTLSAMAVQANDSGTKAGAVGYFSMPEIQVQPGETFVLPVSFTCEDPVRILAFSVSFSEGFEVVKVEKGNRVNDNAMFQYGTPAGECNVAFYDLSGESIFEGNDGAVVNITLKAAENAAGDYTVTVSEGNYGIVGVYNDAQYPDDVSTTIHITTTPTPGALGYFTMPEIQVEPGETFVLPISFTCEDPVRALGIYTTVPEGFEVISVEPTDRVIGSFQYATPEGACNMAIYDINNQRVIEGNDGVIVNITLKASENLSGDYTYTINRSDYGIVGTTDALYPENVSTTIHVNGVPTPGALGYFTMPEIDAMPGDTFVLPVSFTCEDPVRILAFGVSIPDGFEVVSVEKGDRVNDNATFQYGTPAGACNVAMYDLSGERILDGNEGVVVNITLRATENVAGDYTVTISNGNYGIVGIYNNPQYPEDANTTIHIHTIGALGQFSMPEIDAMPGETFVLPVSFSCEDPVRILAFGVSIPDGFEVVSVEQGDRVNDNATFQYGTPAGECNVAIYDLSGERILDGNEGVVVNITLKAGENTAGDYNVTVSNGNYGIVGIYNNPQYPYDVTTPIHIVAAAPECDVNGDNKVNINDVSDLISYLLSGNDDDINTESADVNHDGKISITDVSDLINYLLSH